MSDQIHMRPALYEESSLILEWRNHPDTRRFFFDSAPIASQIHNDWFSSILKSPTNYLLIGEDNSKKPVGVVRFDQVGKTADVSIYLVPDRRGKGLGIKLLNSAIDWVCLNTDVENIQADILSQNIASQKMFIASGFVSSSYRLVFKLYR